MVGTYPPPPVRPRTGTPYDLIAVPNYDNHGVPEPDWYTNVSHSNDEISSAHRHDHPAYAHRYRLEHRLDRLRSNDVSTERLEMTLSDVLALYLDASISEEAARLDDDGGRREDFPAVPPVETLELDRWRPLEHSYWRRLQEGLRRNTNVSAVQLDWNPSAVFVRNNEVQTNALHRRLAEMHGLPGQSENDDQPTEYASREFLGRMGRMISALKNLRRLEILSIRCAADEGTMGINYVHGAVRLLEGVATASSAHRHRCVRELVLGFESGARVRPAEPRPGTPPPPRPEIAAALARCHFDTLQSLTVHLTGRYHGDEALGLVRAICHAVPSLTVLEELTLANKVISGDRALTTADLVACFRPQSIRSIVIDRLHVSDRDLAEASRQGLGTRNRVLERFVLIETNRPRTRPLTVTHEGVMGFVRGLANNVTLQELSLPGNIPKQVMGGLIKSLRDVYGLRDFGYYAAELDPQCEHSLRGLLAMNAAGRAYVKSQPSHLSRAIDVWASVHDDLTPLFFHLRENPLAFQAWRTGCTSATSGSAVEGTAQRQASTKRTSSTRKRLREVEAELRDSQETNATIQ